MYQKNSSEGSNIKIVLFEFNETLCFRYTETDSRPLTPAPTITSNHTRNSGSRRCVTPNPEMCEKKRLILDLRRSHSQVRLLFSHFFYYAYLLLRKPYLGVVVRVP